jgi:hypothetical protein
MTIPECSIEKSASTLVDIFGDAAPAQARERMDEYQQDVYKDGYRFWLAVAVAATKLLVQERSRNSRQSLVENTGAPVPLHAKMVRGHG